MPISRRKFQVTLNGHHFYDPLFSIVAESINQSQRLYNFLNAVFRSTCNRINRCDCHETFERNNRCYWFFVPIVRYSAFRFIASNCNRLVNNDTKRKLIFVVHRFQTGKSRFHGQIEIFL